MSGQQPQQPPLPREQLQDLAAAVVGPTSCHLSDPGEEALDPSGLPGLVLVRTSIAAAHNANDNCPFAAFGIALIQKVGATAVSLTCILE